MKKKAAICIALLLLFAVLIRLSDQLSKGALLRFAAENGVTPLARGLIIAGSDIHAQNDAAINLAANNGHIEIVKLLLEKGVTIQARNEGVLVHAINSGNIPILILVLDHSDFRLPCDSPLIHLADVSKNNEVIRLIRGHIDTKLYKCDQNGVPISDTPPDPVLVKGHLYQEADIAYENKDYTNAAKYFQQAADLGHVPSKYALGALYLNGEGVPKDPAKALSLFQDAAYNGYRYALTYIGYMYLGGLGVERDYTKALKYLKDASDQGDGRATSLIADIYFNGWGATRDPDAANQWWLKAAKQGDPDAEYRLSWNYLNGYGVPRDRETSQKWFKKAKADGYKPESKDAEKISPLQNNTAVFDSISPYEEGPQAEDLWYSRIYNHFKDPEDSDYNTLEGWCEDITKHQTKVADGRWLIDLYVSGFGSYFSNYTSQDNVWDKDHKKILDWIAKFPDSPCAPFIEAEFWYNYAWTARGGGWASSVTPENWKLFNVRLKTGGDIVEKYKSLANATPRWFTESIRVALGSNSPNSQTIALLAAGLRSYPDYFLPSLFVANRFTPRWGGNWKIVDDFVRTIVASTDKSQKNILYSRLYWNVGEEEISLAGPMHDQPTDFFHTTLANWMMMKAGFIDLQTHYPNSAWILNNFALFACLAEDATTYKELRAKIKGDNYYSEAWPEKLKIEDCDTKFKVSLPL